MKANISRTLTGIIVIAVGIGFLLGTLNIFDVRGTLGTWWPSLLVIVGLLMLINNRRNYLWALLIAGVGAILQLNRLDIISANPWEFFWPLLIILVGGSILFRRSGVHSDDSKAERADSTAILGGSNIRNTSSDFKGAKLTAVLGGIKLDLRKATIQKEATLDVFTCMGGVELVVPRNVQVRNQAAAILGGTEDKSEVDDPKKGPTLYIVGTLMLGGIEIKN